LTLTLHCAAAKQSSSCNEQFLQCLITHPRKSTHALGIPLVVPQRCAVVTYYVVANADKIPSNVQISKISPFMLGTDMLQVYLVNPSKAHIY